MDVFISCSRFKGNTIDFYLSESRDKQAAKRFFMKALAASHICKPRVITVDKNPAYPVAIQELIEETRVQVRELNQKEAEFLISFFPKIVKATRNREHLEKRNLLIGYLLYTTGLRASELLSMHWGSFRYNRKGFLYANVIGKGKKPRSIPIRDETKDILFNYRKSMG